MEQWLTGLVGLLTTTNKWCFGSFCIEEIERDLPNINRVLHEH